MFNKKIIFCAEKKHMVDIWPHPVPASKVIPDDYKKLNSFTDGNVMSPTVKKCIPFLDSLTAGYIIRFDQDYVVQPVGDDFSIFPATKNDDDVDFHSYQQLPESYKKMAGQNAGKFINKWLIKTPPGYSCLFVPPMNRIEKRFKIIEGVVDTDTYINIINFPFVLLEKEKQFMIKKGEPMVQCIPFKRESWKMWSGFYKEELHAKTLDTLNTKWTDKYKNLFWKKKSYK